MQILVLGMHRSGTSMTTRLINMMGAYFGPESSVGELKPDNPKGFWERPEVQKLNDSVLSMQGCSWDKVGLWNDKASTQISDNLQKSIRRTVLGMDAYRPWVLKDPRMCITLPAWTPVMEVPVGVIVYRDPSEIAVSLKKRNNMPEAYGIALWEYYCVHMLNASKDMPRLYVNHADMIQNPVDTAQNLCKQLQEAGVRRLDMPSAREIEAFFDPKLHRAKAEASKAELTPEQETLCAIMQNKAPLTDTLKVSDASLKILKKN